MAYYFLDKPFRSGAVLEYLLTAKHSVIVSLDIGHGESTAWIHEYLHGQWQSRQLRLDEQDAPSIPTYISYDRDGVRIGHDADRLHFYQHFKEPPDKWNKTQKAALKDFIAQFWKNLKHWNPRLKSAEEAGNLQLVVGCPASKDWMGDDRYRDLIREATGCSSTVVVSEATAAVMHAVFQGNLDLRQGVAIYDIGSSTVDFVYLWMGKKMISRSLSLGGRDVDYGMLHRILAENRMTMQDIPRDQRQYVLSQIRGIKEDFYPGKEPRERNLYLLKTDAEGKTIRSPQTVDGGIVLPGIPERVLTVKMNDAFMQKVLREDTRLEDYPDSSWHTVLAHFFHDTFVTIGSRPCAAVILSGGTSNIPEVCALAEQTYREKTNRVCQSREPSAAVAQGLCIARGRVGQVMQWMQQMMGEKALQTKLKQDVLREYLTSLGYEKHCEEISDIDSSAVKRAAAKTVQDHLHSGETPRISAFSEKMKQWIEVEKKSETVTGALKKLLQNPGYQLTDTVTSLANEVIPNASGTLWKTQDTCLLYEALAEDRNYLATVRNEIPHADAKGITLSMLSDRRIFTLISFTSYIISAVLSLLPVPPKMVHKLIPKQFRDHFEKYDYSDGMDSLFEKEFANWWTRSWMYAELPRDYILLAMEKADTEISTEALQAMVESTVFLTIKEELLLSQTLKSQYAMLVSDLFELALGQLLFLVFEEPADL